MESRFSMAVGEMSAQSAKRSNAARKPAEAQEENAGRVSVSLSVAQFVIDGSAYRKRVVVGTGL